MTGWGAPQSGKGFGCVFNFDGSTGNLIWSFPIRAEVDSSPAIMTTNTGTIIVIGDGTNDVHGFPSSILVLSIVLGRLFGLIIRERMSHLPDIHDIANALHSFVGIRFGVHQLRVQ